MADFEAICIAMIKRSKALYSLIQSVQGSLDDVDILYNSEEGITESQAIARYLWTNVLPDMEPGLLEPGEGFGVVLADGHLVTKPHSWFSILIKASLKEELVEPEAYGIIIDPYFPGAYPQIISLDTDSPIFPQYFPDRLYGVGEAPE